MSPPEPAGSREAQRIGAASGTLAQSLQHEPGGEGRGWHLLWKIMWFYALDTAGRQMVKTTGKKIH